MIVKWYDKESCVSVAYYQVEIGPQNCISCEPFVIINISFILGGTHKCFKVSLCELIM